VAEAAAVAAVRAQRVEVDALLAFRAAAPGTPAAADAWWRLQAARRARLALILPEEARSLRPLPPPPREAVTGWQALRHRLGLLRWENAATPARFAHGQPARARG
jgi:hypothetical protein